VSVFDFAWRPFFLSHAKDPDARRLFARILTYVVLLMALVFAGLTLFLGDAVRWHIFFGRSLIAQKYWTGLSIVPVVLLAYVFLGIYNNLIAGIYIEKRTSLLPGVTFAAAAINVVANYALIPSFGMMGGAVATLLSYVAMAVILYVLVRKIYPVDYEWGRLLKITVATAFSVAFGLFLQHTHLALLWKALALLGLPGLLYVMGFYVRGELDLLKRLFLSVGNLRTRQG
jgi:O-antigen/teichoic acid export membrane protein